MRRQMTATDREEIIRLRLEGFKYSAIADMVGRPQSTVRTVCNEAGIEQHRRNPRRTGNRGKVYGIGIFLLPNRHASFRYESCIIKTKE